MRLFDRIHEFKKIFLKREQENTEFIRNENLEKLMKFSAAINDLLQEYRYIAKSEYIGLQKKFEETEKYFQVLEDSGMLSDFCAKNHTSQEKVDEILAFYKNAESEIEKHNDIYFRSTEKRKGISG